MISLVVVNYRSAALAIEAVRSARAATAQPLQVVVVDNSDEGERLRGHADVFIASNTNRGYAGAINDGRRACEGDVIVLCNPDVVFHARAIDELVAALDARTSVAGPALFWDAQCRWFLPPAESHSAADVLGEVLAGRSAAMHKIRDTRRVRRRLAFWSLTAPAEVRAISGAVMAIRRDAFDRAGGFDERFFLYFEETDFLRRVSSRIVYVPSARCTHLYNQSAGQADDADRMYADSERKYLEKWNGPFVARTLLRWRRPLKHFAATEVAGAISVPANVVVEASPLASFDTAAGFFPADGTADLPPDVRASYRGDAVYLRVLQRDTAEVVAVYRRRLRD